MRKVTKSGICAVLVVLALVVSGCPKDPYRASLSGSAKVADAIHEATTAAKDYYGQGKLTDGEKKAIGEYLDAVNTANEKFKKSVDATHAAGTVGAQAYLDAAQAFVDAVPTDPLAFHYKSADSQAKFNTVLGAVKTALNGISLAIQSAKQK